jgi:hypothetical protein
VKHAVDLFSSPCTFTGTIVHACGRKPKFVLKMLAAKSMKLFCQETKFTKFCSVLSMKISAKIKRNFSKIIRKNTGGKGTNNVFFCLLVILYP